MENPFSSEVVSAVMRHMNDDHPSDCLVICQGLGGQLDASGARMTGMDGKGIDFVAVGPAGEVAIRLKWGQEISEREQIRGEVTEMANAARRALGMDVPNANESEHASRPTH